MVNSSDIQIAESTQDTPSEAEIEDWIRKTLAHTNRDSADITVRVVDSTEITTLNGKYRKQNVHTDVLAFSANLPNGVDIDMLGDVVVCADVINQVAAEMKVKAQAHWARIIIHGVLHLCGYDHQELDQAEKMELAEFQILKQLELEHPELTAKFKQ